MGIMTCLQDGPLVVILSLGLDLSFELLTTFWIESIFLFGRLEKASLIFNVFIAMLEETALEFCLDDEA